MLKDEPGWHLPLQNPASYQIQITGEGATTQQYVWVSGESGGTWPNLPDQHIQLETDQESYQPGDTARVFLPNPFPENALALVSIERSRLMRTEVIRLTKPSQILEIPLSATDAPNVYVAVTLLGKQADGIPDFRQGYQELKVDPSDQKLETSLIPSQTQAQPGEAVDFTLTVKDASGEPVEGEFSLAVVDKATLALVGGDYLGITEAFYGSQSLGVSKQPFAGFLRAPDRTSPAGIGWWRRWIYDLSHPGRFS